MDVGSRRFALFAGLAIAGAIALAALAGTAGQGVAVAVAVTAIAALVSSYAWMGLMAVRAPRDPRAAERLRRWGRVHILLLLGTPLVILAAHPWGKATIAVAGAVLLCQLVFTPAIVVIGSILQRRARRRANGE